VQFITGGYGAFVIEDADLLLKSRASGNEDLQRFLAIGDGIIRAQGRKIIFTTNLPNIGDVDEALLRPGRCFAVVQTRMLDHEEIRRLAERLCAQSHRDVCEAVIAKILGAGVRSASVASIYRAYAETCR
jgi:ATP-dependent 26S proteasome regulatory subunit